MKLSQALLLILASVAITIAVGFFLFAPRETTFTSAPAHKETAYERVMRTGTIRCGYIVYNPHFMKDVNTGRVSGIFADLMTEVGLLLKLKIEWAEEAGLPNLIEGLRTGRLDAICSGLWANAIRGKDTEFSRPLFYNALGVYARASDTRFDNNLDRINSPDVRIAVIDGEMADQLASTDFPQAKKVSLPQLTDFSQLFLNVTTKKADVTIAGYSEGIDFLNSNPNSIKKVDTRLPIRTFSNVLLYIKNEFALKSMIDNAIDEVEASGRLEKIINRHEKTPGSFYRIAKPYEAPQ